MKTVLLAAAIAGGLTSSPFASIETGCAYATITSDDQVIIDWQCVTMSAENYKLRRRSAEKADAFAFVLESLRNGTAIAK
jgi:hypothetical protein